MKRLVIHGPQTAPGRALRHVLQLLLAALILFPLLYAVNLSFLSLDEVFVRPPVIIPDSLSLYNYEDALRTVPLLRFMLNSLVVSLGIMTGQLLVCSLAAFAFSFFEFKGRQALFMLLLVTMMVPGETILISNYMTIGDLGWYDTYAALILPGVASAFAVFFLRQSFLKMPRDLYESAQIDGCGSLRFFASILIPLSKGPLGALGIYGFINAWNQYLWPLMVTNKTQMRTVQVGIGMLKNAEGLNWNMIMAGITIILLPSFLVFFIGQKRMLSGALSGAIKG